MIEAERVDVIEPKDVQFHVGDDGYVDVLFVGVDERKVVIRFLPAGIDWMAKVCAQFIEEHPLEGNHAH